VPDPRPQPETVRQILQAWEDAQAQLVVLRQQVEHASQLARAKVQSNLLQRDLDRAYRDLGEAVWAEISKGKLSLPGTLAPVRKALEAVTRSIQAQNASIDDLLSEGEDLARRLQEKMTGASKSVASGAKKR
jgi:hypothetical protein